DKLLTAGKADPAALQASGLVGLTVTAGQTWAQLLKRPEVTIEPVLRAVRDRLEKEPLLAEFGILASRQVGESGSQSAGDAHVLRAMLRNEARAVETEIKFAGYLD